METNVQRRLNCLSRHLFPPPEGPYPPLLYPVGARGIERGQDDKGGAVVIGGMVLDIHATPSLPPSPRTTTPGQIHYVLGGVARNVAECMSKLGTRPFMISALGLDMAGELLLRQWNLAGLSTEGIRKHQDIRTPVICNIFDTHGELAAAVASVEAIEKFLTPEWIHQFKVNIDSASILMVDANLTAPALAASCEAASKSNVPVWFEPVSIAKSRKIASVVKHVCFASPNKDELIAMANALSNGNTLSLVHKEDSHTCPIESLFDTLKPAISVLLEKGIKLVVLTLGAKGVLLCSRGPDPMRMRLERTERSRSNGQLHDIVASSSSGFFEASSKQPQAASSPFAVYFPAIPASVVRLTGAGDCLVGGTLASLCCGLDVMQSVAVGIAAATAAVEAETNVPSEFMLNAIADGAKWVYSMAKVL